MKKFTKLFLSCAAVAALTAAIATSAMAADLKGQITGTYDAGTLTLTAPNADDAIKTVVVLDADDAAADPNTVQIKSKNVIGIDQVTENTIVVKLDEAKVDTENKKYTVLVGGSAGQVYEATFGKGGILMGDVNLTGDVDTADALAIVRHALETTLLTGDNLAAADVNSTGDVDTADALCIVRFALDFTDGIGVAGQVK